MSPNLEMVLRILLAAALGAGIGLQREKAKRPAGLRTNALICVGAALFTLSGIYGFSGIDPARIAAGVVTGIGFLGAGAIMRREGEIVTGLTTAASIWTVAGIGVAAGAGLVPLSIVAAAITFVILVLPHQIR